MNNLSVLYVEDDEIVRENFTQILQRYFTIVLVADNGLSALEIYQKHHPDVAILDISIPHLSGLQLAEKIRLDNDDTQIIMLTAYADQEKLLQAVNLQLFAYLIKPVSQIKLDKTLVKLKKKIAKKKILQLAYGYHWSKEEEILYYGTEAIKLTHNEQLIIAHLCRSPGRYYNAAELADVVFDNNPGNSEDTIEYNSLVQLISRLRKKLLSKNNNAGFFIGNVYGAGYKIKLDRREK